MKGLPFNVDMARAWHDGRKSVSRRLMKPQPGGVITDWSFDTEPGDVVIYRGWPHKLYESKGRNKRAAGELTPVKINPPYQAGEVVYIQETYKAWFPLDEDGQPLSGWWHVRYQSDNAEIITGVEWDEGSDYSSPFDVGLDKEPESWKSLITMSEKFSRSKARIVSVRAERVQEISAGDAFDEGFNYRGSDGELHHLGGHPSYSLLEFKFSWDTIYPGSWERNDWVWVYGLEKWKKTP